MPATDAILFFTGGALTLAAGLIAEWYRDRRRTKLLVLLLKQALRDDLERAIVTYDEIHKNYTTNSFVSFAHTQAIQDSRAAYDRNRDAILFLDADLRQAIINYYLHSWQTLAELVNAQQRKETVDTIERGVLASLINKTDPATGQVYTPAELQRVTQAQMTPANILERNLAMTFLKSNLANNLDALKKEAKAVLAQL